MSSSFAWIVNIRDNLGVPVVIVQLQSIVYLHCAIYVQCIICQCTMGVPVVNVSKTDGTVHRIATRCN